MKHISRYPKGKANGGAVLYRDDAAVQKVRWQNPLKGDERKVAVAEVKVKKAGVFVGFRMRF